MVRWNFSHPTVVVEVKDVAEGRGGGLVFLAAESAEEEEAGELLFGWLILLFSLDRVAFLFCAVKVRQDRAKGKRFSLP